MADSLMVRLAALAVLRGVLSRHEYLNLALKKQRFDDPRDQRFATALVSTTLENLYKIDYVLARFVRLNRTDPVVLDILRLGTAQILQMQGVADHAAVNESVRLAARRRPRQKGLVNAVLRNVLRERERIPYPDPHEDFPYYLHIVYSYPLWICRQFVRQFGPEMAEKLVSYHRSHDLTGIRLTGSFEGPSPYEPGIYLDDAAYIRSSTRLDELPAFRRGEITAQSESSMLCVRAAGIEAADRILDLCAAPGGKTAYAAQLAQNGEVIACDLHSHRVALIEETAARLGLKNVTALRQDARELRPEWENSFSVVLVDAPCTALGLLYRKPDVKIFKQEDDVPELAHLQREILRNAARYVAPGGTLIYSTCTMDAPENQDNAAWFAAEHPGFSRGSLGRLLPGRIGEMGVGGEVQLLPPRDNVDGFFIARFEKHADSTRQ